MRADAASVSGMDWRTTSAADLGRGIEAGRIDPRDLAEAFLEAIAAHPLGPRIYARSTPERARAEAAAAAARKGFRRSPLDGVPLSWKDLFDTAGIATEAGSALLAGRVPTRDAEALARASAAGTVCLGKTHMSELAFSGLGLNPVTATPPCVNDPAAVAGGSSSGAAASVAFGLAPAAVGSDTGGSVRLPAAWNDLVGFKPGHGTLPVAGVVPLCPSFDTVGPLCRTVEDAALLWGVLRAARAPDLRGAHLSGTRLLVLKTVALDDLEPAVGTGFEAAVARLARAGARIRHAAIPEVADALALAGRVYAPEAYGLWRDAIESAPGKMYDRVRERFRGGRDVAAADAVAAWETLDRLRALFRDATAGFDAVLMPTAQIVPPDATRLAADADFYTERNLAALRNTRIGNLMGLAALTVPTGTPSVGISLCTPSGSEARLLRLGRAAEAALGA